MTAALRTVRLLDREPGKATESRVVRGVTVETGVPMPSRQIGKIDSVLAAMHVGESFEHTARVCSRKPLPGRKFTQRLQPNGKWRIWRTQ